MIEVHLPNRGHNVVMVHRSTMRRGSPPKPMHLFDTPLPTLPLPIDWSKGGALDFPMYGNDQYGDCMYAAACHGDNTFTGNIGVESTFNLQTIITDYLKLAGGDNGLDEPQLASEWKRGLASTPAAAILDTFDIDPTDQNMMQYCIGKFQNVIFMFACPNSWINEFNPGVRFTLPAKADEDNGHGVLLNGVRSNKDYDLKTWGSQCWLDPAAIPSVDPSAFVVFSTRMFNAQGYAADGEHYVTKAQEWLLVTGKTLPASSFPPPVPTPLPPSPTPAPVPTPVPPTPGPIPPTPTPIPPMPSPIPWITVEDLLDEEGVVLKKLITEYPSLVWIWAALDNVPAEQENWELLTFLQGWINKFTGAQPPATK